MVEPGFKLWPPRPPSSLCLQSPQPFLVHRRLLAWHPIPSPRPGQLPRDDHFTTISVITLRCRKLKAGPPRIHHRALQAVMTLLFCLLGCGPAGRVQLGGGHTGWQSWRWPLRSGRETEAQRDGAGPGWHSSARRKVAWKSNSRYRHHDEPPLLGTNHPPSSHIQET